MNDDQQGIEQLERELAEGNEELLLAISRVRREQGAGAGARVGFHRISGAARALSNLRGAASCR
jgi:hypothetical protein